MGPNSTICKTQFNGQSLLEVPICIWFFFMDFHWIIFPLTLSWRLEMALSALLSIMHIFFFFNQYSSLQDLYLLSFYFWGNCTDINCRLAVELEILYFLWLLHTQMFLFMHVTFHHVLLTWSRFVFPGLSLSLTYSWLYEWTQLRICNKYIVFYCSGPTQVWVELFIRIIYIYFVMLMNYFWFVLDNLDGTRKFVKIKILLGGTLFYLYPIIWTKTRFQ